MEDQSRQSYRLHICGSCGGLETSRCGAGGGQELVDITGASSRGHGPVAELPELGLGEPESTHRWTGLTCWAAPLACFDWSEGRDVGRYRLDWVEGGGDNGKPGRTGSHARCADKGVLICAVGALVIAHWDLIWHWFTLSVSKGFSSDQGTNLRSSYNGLLHDYI